MRLIITDHEWAIEKDLLAFIKCNTMGFPIPV